MRIVVSIQGDTVDSLCYRNGVDSSRVVEVMGLNPGLCEKGVVMAAGVEVLLPDKSESGTSKNVKVLQLWE